jgi:hypothetical protein
VNQKKAKALRRAAKKVAAMYPIHQKGDTYQDIVKRTIQKVVTRIPPTLMQKARKFFGLKNPPIKTKVVERVVKESRQLVLSSGVKFILRRLKAAMKRGALLTTDPLFVNPHKGTR